MPDTERSKEAEALPQKQEKGRVLGIRLWHVLCC